MSSSIRGILAFVVLFLLLLNLFALVYGSGQEWTFSRFMSIVENVPKPDLSQLNRLINLEIVEDWGVFNFLRDFFNRFLDLFGVFFYVLNYIVQLISILVYFVGAFFGWSSV